MQLLNIILLVALTVFFATPGQSISWDEIRQLALTKYSQVHHHKKRIDEGTIRNIQQLTPNSEKFDAYISTSHMFHQDCKGIAYRFPENYLQQPREYLGPHPERSIEMLNFGRCEYFKKEYRDQHSNTEQKFHQHNAASVDTSLNIQNLEILPVVTIRMLKSLIWNDDQMITISAAMIY
ncbi:hypothetical protein WDU94_014242 [Cyamophila willieti]